MAQQELLLSALHRQPFVRHVVHLFDMDMERHMEWTRMYRGDGNRRLPEPALLRGFASSLPKVDRWVAVKAQLLLGSAESPFLKEVADYRRIFGFDGEEEGVVCDDV